MLCRFRRLYLVPMFPAGGGTARCARGGTGSGPPGGSLWSRSRGPRRCGQAAPWPCAGGLQPDRAPPLRPALGDVAQERLVRRRWLAAACWLHRGSAAQPGSPRCVHAARKPTYYGTGHSIHRVGSHSSRRRSWRLLAALLVTALSAAAIGYFVRSAQPTSPTPRPALPTSLTPLASVHVTCKDRSTDAATLQHAINSSPVGAAIEFQGGTCLLTTGLTLLGDRTYTGENTTGTVLQQSGSASYILASSAYVDNSTSYRRSAEHP